MKPVQVFTVAIVAGGLIAFTGIPSVVQHSSGGTLPSVTEEASGNSGGSSGQDPSDQILDTSRSRGQGDQSGGG